MKKSQNTRNITLKTKQSLTWSRNFNSCWISTLAASFLQGTALSCFNPTLHQCTQHHTRQAVNIETLGRPKSINVWEKYHRTSTNRVRSIHCSRSEKVRNSPPLRRESQAERSNLTRVVPHTPYAWMYRLATQSNGLLGARCWQQLLLDQLKTPTITWPPLYCTTVFIASSASSLFYKKPLAHFKVLWTWSYSASDSNLHSFTCMTMWSLPWYQNNILIMLAEFFCSKTTPRPRWRSRRVAFSPIQLLT